MSGNSESSVYFLKNGQTFVDYLEVTHILKLIINNIIRKRKIHE